MATTTRNPIDGVELSYDVVGEGQAILLLHGSLLSKAIWRGFGYVSALRDNFTVITMDLRGHGRSGKPHEQSAYSLDSMTADALAVLDAAGHQRAHIAGYSVGARIGYSLALNSPQRVSTLTTFGGTFKIESQNVGELFFPEYDAALRTGDMAAFVAGWEARIGKPLDPQTRAAMMANDAHAMSSYFRETVTSAALTEDQLRGITVPALLFAGTRDPVRLIDSELAASLMPNASCIALEGRNHGSTLIPARPILDDWLAFLLSN